MKNKFIPEDQNIISFSLMGPESGGPCLVDSNDGKITRIRPYHYDKEYTDKYCNPWKIEARGSTFSEPIYFAVHSSAGVWMDRVAASKTLGYA